MCLWTSCPTISPGKNTVCERTSPSKQHTQSQELTKACTHAHAPGRIRVPDSQARTCLPSARSAARTGAWGLAHRGARHAVARMWRYGAMAYEFVNEGRMPAGKFLGLAVSTLVFLAMLWRYSRGSEARRKEEANADRAARAREAMQEQLRLESTQRNRWPPLLRCESSLECCSCEAS